jgi:hypothetical protein
MATINDTANGTLNGPSAITTDDALAVTAGDLVYTFIKWEQNPTADPTCDTGDSTPLFSVANAKLAHGNDDLFCKAFYWTATSTGTVTPRVSFGSITFWMELLAISVTPAGGTTLSLGNVNAATGTGSSPSAGSAAATAAGVAFTGFGLYGSRTLNEGSGWVEPAEFDVSIAAHAQYQLQSGAGTLTGDGALVGGSIEWVAQMAIFNESGGAGPPANQVPTGNAQRNRRTTGRYMRSMAGLLVPRPGILVPSYG